jgi:hypothetical protein
MAIMRFRSLAILMVAATVSLSACGKSDTAANVADPVAGNETAAEEAPQAEAKAKSNVNPDAGKSEAGKYSNDYFGFSMTFPAEWAIAPKETTEALQSQGSDIVAGDDPTLKAAVEAAEENSYQLLMISEKPVGAPVADFNANIVVMAEKVSHLPGLVSGADYLASVSNLLQQTDLPYQPAGEIKEVEIGGRKFHRADFTLAMNGMEVQQSYFATIDKGYALGFILSGNDTSMANLEKIASSVVFN